MLDNPARNLLSRLAKPISKFYARIGITPNQLTLLALATGILSATLVVAHRPGLALLVWWFSRFLDGTDGLYARESRQTTLFGAHLDIVCDMGAYSIMILAFNAIYPQYSNFWLAILFFYILCITGALSLGALEKEKGLLARDNRGLRLGAGLAEGGETGLAYTVFLLFPQSLPVCLWIWLGVLLTTVVSRLILASRTLR